MSNHVAFRLDNASQRALALVLGINGRQQSEFIRAALASALQRELAAIGESLGRPTDGVHVAVEDAGVGSSRNSIAG